MCHILSKRITNFCPLSYNVGLLRIKEGILQSYKGQLEGMASSSNYIWITIVANPLPMIFIHGGFSNWIYKDVHNLMCIALMLLK
jgi:hypothetical protein